MHDANTVVSKNSNYGYTVSRQYSLRNFTPENPRRWFTIAARILIRFNSSHPWRLKRMERIDDDMPGRRPGMTAPNFDLPSILPLRLPLKTPDSLQKFSV
jgi:hypothetical protein